MSALDTVRQLEAQLAQDDVTRQRAYDAVKAERDSVRRTNDALLAENTRLGKHLDDANAVASDALAARDSVRAEHADLLAAHGKLQREMDELTADEVRRRPLLGLATTQQLLDEVATRVEVHGPGLQYRTVDPH